MLQLAIAVASANAPANAFVVWRGFEASIEKARRLGYDGVELALRQADELAPGRIESLLRREGLSCPCISTGQVFATLGLHFTTGDPARRRQVIDVFRGLIDLAGTLGAKVNIGRARGFVEPGQDPLEARRRFIDVARQLAEYARGPKVTLILEPVNRYEINFINSLEQAAALLEEVGAPNFALMPDVFHMNIEDATIAGELERFCPRIGYVHLADSNRLAPGQGHTDFPAIFAALRRGGYKGWASVEILPQPDPDTAARQAIEFLRPLIKAYNDADA
jgi:sugar phosphate isomerase/epimerase